MKDVPSSKPIECEPIDGLLGESLAEGGPWREGQETYFPHKNKVVVVCRFLLTVKQKPKLWSFF